MAKYFTDEDVRDALLKGIGRRTQAEAARAIGIKPQNLSVMVNGGPIHGKALAWLGFRGVKGLYERLPKEPS